ncbi:hypothetical protein, partial [Staphylococcus aureus]
YFFFNDTATTEIFLMIRRPPRSTRVRSSAASDVYKRQTPMLDTIRMAIVLSLIHISEPTRHAQISYAVFCLKKSRMPSSA